jgi:hypothetical protein
MSSISHSAVSISIDVEYVSREARNEKINVTKRLREMLVVTRKSDVSQQAKYVWHVQLIWARYLANSGRSLLLAAG